ncbi:MAG: uridine diphosphate-N-acetylglucosamine-binding protein YvcK [Candidatus Nanopelagicales bacterium]
MAVNNRGPQQKIGPAVVALGGGHGLSMSLRALRNLTDNLTAIVGVSDNGGSSGRLRDEFDLIPPGDLRMALAALCGDDAWGRTWSRIMQHRYPGDGELAGHAAGNLLITALWQETANTVEGLDWMAALLGAHGRVLPVANEPLSLVAQIEGADPAHPDEVKEVVGQVQIERSPGIVKSLDIVPADPQPCPEAIAALAVADGIVLGPGSWYTSVLPHLLVPEIRTAIRESTGVKILVLNLDPQKGDEAEAKPHSNLETWVEQFGDVPLDYVLVDTSSESERSELERLCSALGARLVTEKLARIDQDGSRMRVHDPLLLAAGLRSLLIHGTIYPWQ